MSETLIESCRYSDRGNLETVKWLVAYTAADVNYKSHRFSPLSCMLQWKYRSG